ncbi:MULTISPECIES: hypothetical protein [unclassified Cryobacterium]|uniref:hypothetical protein n=1 Tax=unclassified Cryobacterium TaxID=2649013 RepID=UPI0018CB4138|nr:hypothetical protein [Cryobacterium sp. CAN_C3]
MDTTSLLDPSLYSVALALVEIVARGLGQIWLALESIAADPATQVLGRLGALLWRLGLRLGKRGGRKRKVWVAAGFECTGPGLPV